MVGNTDELVKKVIEMRFENSQFETATAETVKSLGRLESSCKALGGAASGLGYLGRAASNLTGVSFTGMSSGIHTVVDGFSAMGTIGDAVLRNLTNRVTDFVMNGVGQFKSFASSLFGMESIMGGFSEYEDKMGSIQTIKTNTAEAGVTLADITKTLDELNHYADQTIYSFKEMTKNIGTFTAAGVSLEDSAVAIKGIANLAAGVGSSPQQASNAMYQLSQALASGTVNLPDWNSVVNAGMGGQYFQNALKETARELAKAKGIAYKEFEGTFRESISGNAKGQPWLTSEVLLETLKKFAHDPSLMEAATRVKTFHQLIDTMKESVGSGWTETWEYLIGNLDEAGDFFTMISKGFDRIVGSASESRNAMMKFWHDNGGRDQLIKALVTGFNNLATATKPIRRAFSEAFPPIGKERLLGMTEGLLSFVSALKLTDPQLEFLRNASDRAFGALKILLNTFKGLAKVVKIVGGKQIPEAFSLLISIAGQAEKAFYSFIGLLEHFLGIDLRIPTMGDFEKFGNFLNDTLDAAKKKFSDSRTALGEFYASLADGKVKEFTDKQADAFKSFFANLTLDDLKRKFDDAKSAAKTFLEQFNIHIPTLSDFWTLIDKVAGGIWNLGEKFQNAAGKVAGFFMSLFPSSNKKVGLSKSVSDETGDMAENVEGSVERTKTAFDYLIGAIDFVMNVAGHIVSRFVDIFRPVWDALIESGKNITFLDIMKIATTFMSVNMYGAITKVMDSLGGLSEAISGIGENFNGMLKAMKGFFESGEGLPIFDDLKDALSNFQKEINTHALINIALAVAILTGSVIALSTVDVDKGLNALFSISLLVGEMLGAMALLSNVAKASGKLTINIAPIILIAVSVAILAGSLRKLALLDTKQLKTGMRGVTLLVLEMAGVAILLGRYGRTFGKGMTSLIVMAFAVSKLANVIIKLGGVELNALLQGGVAVGAIMAALVGLSYALRKAPVQKLTSLGAGLILFAFGIKILTGAIQALGNLDTQTLLKGGAALAALTVGVIAFSYALWAAPVAKLIVVGVGLIAIAAGMTALATAAFLFSRFSWTSLGKAGAALGGILLAATAASYLIRPLQLLAIAGALTVLGVALFALAVDFKIFASLGIEGLIISIASFASVLFLMGVAGALLGPMVPTILALAGAMTLFGLGIGLLGVGAMALSAGLAALGPGIVMAAASVGAALGMFVAGVIEGAAEILNALASMATALGSAFYAIGLALVEAIVALAGPITAGIVVLCIVLLENLTNYMDPLIDKIINFIGTFLDRILEDVLPMLLIWSWKLVVKAADLILLALEGIFGVIPGVKDWFQGIRDDMNGYWDDVIDAKEIQLKNKRKMRMIEEGLVDAAGNVNIAGKANSAGQAYVDDFLGTLRGGEKDISNEAGKISGIMTSVRHDTGDTSGRSGSFGDSVDEAKRSVDGYSESVGSFDSANTQAKKSLKDLRSEIDQNNAAIADEIQTANDVINGKYGNGDKRRDALKEAGYDPDRIQVAVNAILSGSDDVEGALKKLGSSVQNVTDNAEEAGETIERFPPELPGAKTAVEDLGGSLGDFSQVLNYTGNNADEFSGQIGGLFDSVSQTDGATRDFSGTLDILSDSIKNATGGSSKLTESFKTMGDELLRNDMFGSFDAGEDFARGYYNGALSKKGLIRDAAYDTGDTSIDALAESIDAHSPSRKTRELALMWGAGFFDTLQSFVRPTRLAGEAIGEESVNGLASPFSTLDYGIDGLYSFSPTITPILDLSNVDDGMAYLQNEFASPTFGVRQTWAPDMRNAEALLSLERPDTDINRVIDEMGYLRDDIVRMGEEMTRIKVYLDTGELVGQMTGPMDEALGSSQRRSVQSGRR